MELKITINENMTSRDVVSNVRKIMALEAYKSGKFSLGYCVDLSGMFYADFIKYLGDNKVSIFKKEDLLNDLETIKTL